MNAIKNQKGIFPEDGIRLHIIDGRLSYCGTYCPLPITLAKIQVFSATPLHASSDHGELYFFSVKKAKRLLLTKQRNRKSYGAMTTKRAPMQHYWRISIWKIMNT